MLSLDALREFAAKEGTSTLNAAREYLQNLFLSRLYEEAEAEKLAFKGGTALRLVYKSPRFSEDLDFTGGLKPYHLKKLLARTAEKTSRDSVPWKTRESKPTSGGYLTLYSCRIHEETVGIEVNVSTRKTPKTTAVLVTSPLTPAYQCLTLPIDDLAGEKMEALLFRKKPRDFYDLYFLLRKRLGIRAIIHRKDALIHALRSQDPKVLQRELKLFLPASHRKMISDLPRALNSELERL